MSHLESTIQVCTDYLLPVFKGVSQADNPINKPLKVDAFPEATLSFHWESLPANTIKEDNMDTFINVVLRKIITDVLLTESDNENADEKEFEEGAGGLDAKLKICACVLDFCFHSRRSRSSPNLWCISYFSLFSTVIDILAWPSSILEFWPYAETRIEWFKMGSSLEPLPLGTTNLISYKQPLFDKLRHWNELLGIVQNNSFLNTPLHYAMKRKLEKFISELLPIYEESNFNRSALSSTKQNSGNPWNKTISSATKSDNSSENIFATDYNYVFDNFLTRPLEFTYKPLDFKLDMDKLLTPLLDAIFELEEDFYKNLKASHKKLADINEKLNSGFPIDLEVIPNRPPRYMRISKKINAERAKYWESFMDFDQSLSLMVQPTLLDISICNPETLYDQMMTLDNDYYRKQFLLQLYFSADLIRNVLTSTEIENYYKSCFQKEKPSKNIRFSNLTGSNLKKTLSLCNHIIDNRIKKFYHSRDPKFLSTIQNLCNLDQAFLRTKINGFKAFQNFQHSNDSLEVISFENSFKKFGFVKLGNKSINNVWKINTGLDLIDKKPLTAKEFYDELRERWQKSSDTDSIAEDEKIVKQWQSLRSLRSRYMADFKDVNEEIGLSGLFDPSLAGDQLKEKKKILEGLKAKLKSPHKKKLEEARNYMRLREKPPCKSLVPSTPNK